MCELHIPNHLAHKFSEMAVICRNTEISGVDFRGHMKTFAEGNEAFKHQTRTLIGSLLEEEILLFRELSAWYFWHGLIITNMYLMYQYIPHKLY